MSERETNQMLHEYEQRIKELTAALRQIAHLAADLREPEAMQRIHQHATVALLHDHVEHGKGWV